MLRFAANLSMMFTEYPFLDRFSAAATDRFQAVEYLFPYDYPASDLASRLKNHGLRQVLFNAPPGCWDAGERGLACLPGREPEFRAEIQRALEYAHGLECPRVHVMAGVIPTGIDRSALRDTYVTNLAWAAELASTAGKDILIEPINPRDMPGYASTARMMPMPSSRRSARRISRYKWIFTTARSSKAMSPQNCESTFTIRSTAALATSRLPVCLIATSQTPAN